MLILKDHQIENHKYLYAPIFVCNYVGLGLERGFEGKWSFVRAFDRYLEEREEAFENSSFIESFDDFIFDNFESFDGEKMIVPEDFDYMGYDFESYDYGDEEHDF